MPAPSPRRLPIRVFLIFLASLSTLRAELTWTQKKAALSADASTAVVEAKFPFKNTGGKALEVTEIMSSCGCTTVALEKRHYEPNEGGEIVARYTIGEHTGLQSKSVMVGTNDGTSPVELTIEVRIPEVLRITPSFVTWKHGEKPGPKEVILELAQDTPIKEISAQSSSASVTAELFPVEKGRKYRLTLTPSHTDQHLFATVTVHAKFGDIERVFRTYATVQPAVREE